MREREIKANQVYREREKLAIGNRDLENTTALLFL